MFTQKLSRNWSMVQFTRVFSHVVSRHSFVVVCQKENVMSNWRLEITVRMMDYSKNVPSLKKTDFTYMRIERPNWKCYFELYAISNVHLSLLAVHKLNSFFKFNWMNKMKRNKWKACHHNFCIRFIIFFLFWLSKNMSIFI